MGLQVTDNFCGVGSLCSLRLASRTSFSGVVSCTDRLCHAWRLEKLRTHVFLAHPGNMHMHD